MSDGYIHGFSEREQKRLVDQALMRHVNRSQINMSIVHYPPHPVYGPFKVNCGRASADQVLTSFIQDFNKVSRRHTFKAKGQPIGSCDTNRRGTTNS